MGACLRGTRPTRGRPGLSRAALLFWRAWSQADHRRVGGGDRRAPRSPSCGSRGGARMGDRFTRSAQLIIFSNCDVRIRASSASRRGGATLRRYATGGLRTVVPGRHLLRGGSGLRDAAAGTQPIPNADRAVRGEHRPHCARCGLPPVRCDPITGFAQGELHTVAQARRERGPAGAGGGRRGSVPPSLATPPRITAVQATGATGRRCRCVSTWKEAAGYAARGPAVSRRSTARAARVSAS
jgi:hypothetical protein